MNGGLSEVYDIPDFLRNPENLAMERKMEKEKINKMVDRFLGWRLPKNFSPDAGISFKPEYNVEYMTKQGKPPMRHEPTGTNLFDAEQAREMIEYLLDESPNPENYNQSDFAEAAGTADTKQQPPGINLFKD